ncbi:MAG: hypothetical protein PHS14_00085 [Elusimicrobia bacterium]|nr:hypothetical protein [Elusimicrobiota bacterium]
MSINPPEFYKLKAEKFVRRTDAEVYSTRFDKQYGWAIIILHEETGVVAITSDYGDWTYSWPSPGRGNCTLKEFVCHGSYDYMACKFEGGKPEEFDGAATRAAFTKRLFQQRRDRSIQKEEARDVYDSLEACEWGGNVEGLYLSADEDLRKWMGSEWYEFNVFTRGHKFYWLRDGILPAIVDEIRKTLPTAEVRS